MLVRSKGADRFKDFRGMTLEDAIAALEALGYTVDRTLGIIEAESDPEGETAAVPAGSVITVKRNGAWSEDRDHRGAVTITVSKGMSAKATRALLFQDCVNNTVEEATAKLVSAGYTVDTATDKQAIEDIAADHVVCVGLVQMVKGDDGVEVEQIVTGDDAPLDLKRIRLVVSSGPDSSGGLDSDLPLVPDADEEKSTEPDYDSWNLLTGTAQSARFTNYSVGSNDGHSHYGHTECWGNSLDETSGDLAIGYKGQGSFLVDFRQVDTDPTGYPNALGTITNRGSNAYGTVTAAYPEGSFFMEQGLSSFYPTRCPSCYSNWAYFDKNSRWVYGTKAVGAGSTDPAAAGNIDWQEHYHRQYYGGHYCYDWANGNPKYNSIGSYTYNTGAHLEMVQDLSGDGFDAYYIKIKRQALSYIDKVTVKYKHEIGRASCRERVCLSV